MRAGLLVVALEAVLVVVMVVVVLVVVAVVAVVSAHTTISGCLTFKTTRGQPPLNEEIHDLGVIKKSGQRHPREAQR